MGGWMNLTQYARKLQADKDAGKLNPPPRPPEAALHEAPLVDEAEWFAAQARRCAKDLIEAAEVGAMKRDPQRAGLIAIANAVRFIGTAVPYIANAVERLESVEPKTQAMTDEQLAELSRRLEFVCKDGAFAGAKRCSERMWRVIDKRTAVWFGAAIGGAFILGQLVQVARVYFLSGW
jgi:hypothetical protein